jgi:hypothetical protein
MINGLMQVKVFRSEVEAEAFRKTSQYADELRVSEVQIVALDETWDTLTGQ